MIRVLYYRIPREAELPDLQPLIAQLPEALQQKVQTYRFWKDQALNLFGKLMLASALQAQGTNLDQLSYNPYGRPFLEGDLDFNISHSAERVVCAWAKGIRLGIDIEQVLDITFEDYGTTMTAQEWSEIRSSPDVARTFFSYWTLKESVIKADGRGFSFPLEAIEIQEGRVGAENQSWYTYPLAIDPDYACHLATNLPQIDIRIQEWVLPV
jgi:4'-phosphopantetheinyl transferase